MAITKTFWEALNEKAKWDVKVALRGPDSYYGETLKWYTTSVIRGHMRKVFRVGGTVNSDLKLVILPLSSYGGNPIKKDKTSWNCTHFIEHVETAAVWLKIPVIHIPPTLWHEVMSTEDIAGAGRTILKKMEEIAKAEDYGSYYTPRLEELRRHLTTI